MKFQKGQSGNPAGRQKGTRNRFTQLKNDILEAYQHKGEEEVPEEAGVGFWRMIKRKYPELFARLTVSMLPKETDINLNTEAIEQAAEITRQMDKITAPGKDMQKKTNARETESEVNLPKRWT